MNVYTSHKSHKNNGFLSKIGYRMMLTRLDRRNKKNPPEETLKEVGITQGSKVLDFGCGPGGHTLAAAEIVGDFGKVYGLDINPIATKRLAKLAFDNGYVNVETITSGCATGLQDSSVDAVLLYDILHGLEDKAPILGELHRVLTNEGTLSVNDHHMQEVEIIKEIEEEGFFKLKGKGSKTYNFEKITSGGTNGRTHASS
jgi:ubiquinone/menaquinone biosynthesis C-methylase UbiE